jgi:Co/Zn/Cd efflux system component
VIAAVSLIAMPLLARAKRKVARTLNSNALHADSRQTDLCAYLSAILLGGLLLNFLLGWWWADPLAGLIMVPIIVREGVEALKGDPCACNEGLEMLGTALPFVSTEDAKNEAPGCDCSDERHG